MDRILNIFLVITLLCHPYVQSHGYFGSHEGHGYGHCKDDKQWDFNSNYKVKPDRHYIPSSKDSGEESDYSDYSGFFEDTSTDNQRNGNDKKFEHPSNGFPHFGPQHWDSSSHGHLEPMNQYEHHGPPNFHHHGPPRNHEHHGPNFDHQGSPSYDYHGHPMNNFGHHGSSNNGFGYPTINPVHQNEPSMNQFHQTGSNPTPNYWENKYPTSNPSTSTSRPTASKSSTTSPRQSSTQTPLALVMCIRSCPVTSEFNPVCGSNNMTYNNIGRLECAQNCGVAVTLQRSSPCTIPTTLAPITNPTNNGNSRPGSNTPRPGPNTPRPGPNTPRPGPNTPRTTTFPTFETKPTRYTTIDFASSSRPGVGGNGQPAQPGRPVNPNSGVTIAPDVLASIFPGNPPTATEDYDGDIDIRFDST